MLCQSIIATQTRCSSPDPDSFSAAGRPASGLDLKKKKNLILSFYYYPGGLDSDWFIWLCIVLLLLNYKGYDRE